MCNDFWSQTVQFEVISYHSDCKGRSIVSVLSWQELFCCIGIEMVSNDSIPVIRAGVSNTLLGEFSSYHIREFDFNYILFILSKNKMLALSRKKAKLTKDGKTFLCENAEKCGLNFYTKKRKEFEMLLGGQKESVKPSP